MFRRAACPAIATLTFVLAATTARADEPTGQQGQVWNLGTQQSGRIFPTEVAVFNESCRGSRDFKVAIEGQIARFLTITGPTELTGIRRGETKSTPARLDLTGAAAGTYEGQVVTRCTNCPPNCNLDYRTISILLAVTVPPGMAVPEAPAGEELALAGGAESLDASHPDPNGDCEIIPEMYANWEDILEEHRAAIVERDGRHEVYLSPGSPFWQFMQTAERTAGTTWEPTATRGQPTTRDASSTWDLATQVRELCLEHLTPCDELLAKVRAAEEAYRRAEARARDATAREGYDQSEAAALDEESARDRDYAATLRRQAKEWKELADSARADAKTNRDRAERQPDYADSWNREAARDDARAAERDANAERLEKEAKRIEDGIRDQTEAADERRGRAEAARQEAAAAKQALDLARAEYEACLERQRMKCEQERREAVAAALRSQAAAATTTSGGGSTAPRGGTTPGGGTTAPGRPYNPYRTVPVRLAPFCEWIRFESPDGTLIDRVWVEGLTSRDTPNQIEVRTHTTRSGTRVGSFEYHCKASAGTAVIRFRAGRQLYQMRIGCVPE